MTQQGRADRPRKERERKRRERLQGCVRRILFGKEKRWENQNRGGCINVEIEEFDRRADGR
jgi:hypothetical protein